MSKASASPATQIDFDGKEVSFSSITNKALRDVSFVVEVVDPTRTVFTTYAWITWQGNQPGDFLTPDVLIDISKQPLNWQKPYSRLRLDVSADVSNNIVTYTVYPQNVGRLRMWDLTINLSLPAGATILSTDASLPFVAAADRQTVTFTTLELPRQEEIEPLTLQFAINESASLPVKVEAWATWKNGGRRIKQFEVASETSRSGTITVQTAVTQRIVSDRVGDVPFAHYDLTSIAIQEDSLDFRVIFHTVDPLGPSDEPLEFLFYVDRDCRSATGLERRGLGVEYRVRYRHERNQTTVHRWDESSQGWARVSTNVRSAAVSNTLTTWVPGDLIAGGQAFCWIGEAKYKAQNFRPNPPTDRLPDSGGVHLNQYTIKKLLLPTPIALR